MNNNNFLLSMHSLKQDSLQKYFTIIESTESFLVAEQKDGTDLQKFLADCKNMMVIEKIENEFIGRYQSTVAVVLLNNKLICKPLA